MKITCREARSAAVTEELSVDLCARIREALLCWYRRGHRDLPWRRVRDPYAIWISEIMLQQTRVETVKDYYRRFMARFPTPLELAEAPLEQVLALWSGLGYYARARNMHSAAQEIVARHGGSFPTTAAGVRSLPGIGPYTAGAILSIAFGQRAALVDGNVIRVLSRLFALEAPQEQAASKQRYWQIAERLVPPPAGGRERNDPGDFNQGLMELGATVCLAQRPTCLVCPLAGLCQGRLEGDPERYPPRRQIRDVKEVELATLLIAHQGRVLLLRRPAAGLWGGLYEPLTGPAASGGERAALVGLAQERLGVSIARRQRSLTELPRFERELTHRRMRFAPYLLKWTGALPTISLDGGYTEARWVDPREPLALGLSAWVSGLLGGIHEHV